MSWSNRATFTKIIVLTCTLWRAGIPAEIQTVTTQAEAWIVTLQQIAWYNAFNHVVYGLCIYVIVTRKFISK